MNEQSLLSQEEIQREQQKLNTLDPKKAVVFNPAQMFALANQFDEKGAHNEAVKLRAAAQRLAAKQDNATQNKPPFTPNAPKPPTPQGGK